MLFSNLIICRPVDQMLSPSWLSHGWFVAQLTAHHHTKEVNVKETESTA